MSSPGGCLELELRPPPPPAPQDVTVLQLCYLDYLQYAEEAERTEVFQAFEYADDPNLSTSNRWRKVHALSDVITRVHITPLMTWDEADFDAERLYHNTDMYVHV